MFVLLPLTLRPHIITPLDAHTGRFFNGLVYRLLESVDPVLSDAWHNHRSLKPFTVSTLTGTTTSIRGITCATPDQSYTLRLTLLEGAAYPAVREALDHLTRHRLPLCMKQYPFTLEEVAGSETSVSAPALLEQAHSRDHITLDFVSPTAFKKENLSLLFPQPWNVFGSLLRNWKAFASEVPLHPDLPTLIESQIAVSRYRLETTYINAMGYHLKGFTGRITYKLLTQDRTVALHLNALADFAEYAGVGMKTTQGMGQVRRVE